MIGSSWKFNHIFLMPGLHSRLGYSSRLLARCKQDEVHTNVDIHTLVQESWITRQYIRDILVSFDSGLIYQHVSETNISLLSCFCCWWFHCLLSIIVYFPRSFFVVFMLSALARTLHLPYLTSYLPTFRYLILGFKLTVSNDNNVWVIKEWVTIIFTWV